MNPFEELLRVSRKVNWSIDGVVRDSFGFDYGRCFLPEALAGAELPFLAPHEQRALNQIRAHGYLCVFRLAEEFILPFVLDYARDNRADDDSETQALLHFAEEEVKHIQLFKLFRDEFQRGFGTHCEVIGSPQTMARTVLDHSELGVALTVLHIEWMTQRHFVESVRDNRSLDVHFRNLLRQHWVEEAQHTKLDELMVRSMVARLDESEVSEGIEDYIGIVAHLDAALGQQVLLDLQTLEQACKRRFAAAEREELVQAQTRAMRHTFLASGMTHPNLLAVVESMSPAGRAKLERIALGFTGWRAQPGRAAPRA